MWFKCITCISSFNYHNKLLKQILVFFYWNIYNAMLISAVWQSDLVIHSYIMVYICIYIMVIHFPLWCICVCVCIYIYYGRTFSIMVYMCVYIFIYILWSYIFHYGVYVYIYMYIMVVHFPLWCICVYIYVYYGRTFSIMVYLRILNIVSCALQQTWFVRSICNSLYLLLLVSCFSHVQLCVTP